MDLIRVVSLRSRRAIWGYGAGLEGEVALGSAKALEFFGNNALGFGGGALALEVGGVIFAQLFFHRTEHFFAEFVSTKVGAGVGDACPQHPPRRSGFHWPGSSSERRRFSIFCSKIWRPAGSS